jgi:hypothetical protein
MNPAFHRFHRQLINPFKFRLFMIQRLPAAFFAGLRIQAFDERHAIISVKYKWFTQNPFRSMYFAVQSMAAEMSTGLLSSAQVYERKPSVSMLVVGMEAKFLKKVTGTAFFTCNDGAVIARAVEETIASGDGRTITCTSVGTDTAGEKVSEFLITWSFKTRQTIKD